MARSTRHDWFSLSSPLSHRPGRQIPTKRQPFSRRLRVEPLESRRLLAVVAVNTLNDTVDFNDGVTSLREAIFATNLVGGADEIQFAPSLTSGGPATITLTQGELKITDSTTIEGPGANLLAIDASGNDPTPDQNNGDGSRVFNIDDGNTANILDVSMSGLTLTGADPTGSRGAIFNNRERLSVATTTISHSRGGITSLSDLVVSDSLITDNDGSGIVCLLGALTVTGSTISNNTGANVGGGINAFEVTVADSTISGNSAVTGGGISGRKITISNSLIADNNGGGILCSGDTLTIVDSTISNNTNTASGGGINVARQSGSFTNVAVYGSTIAGNTSLYGDGGGISIRYTNLNNNVTITDTSIAGNSASRNGGGIHMERGSLTVTRSEIVDNVAGAAYVGFQTVNGGGIYHRSSNGDPYALNVVDTTIHGNSAPDDGGGIFHGFGPATVTGTTISGNTAGRSGGGIYSSLYSADLLTISSTTISGNAANGSTGSARGGGGVYGSFMSISNSTITGNSSLRYGGGIRGGHVNLTHSIVSNNFAAEYGGNSTPDDIRAKLAVAFSLLGVNNHLTITDLGGNLIGTPEAPINAKLGPLADNGGPTMTHALLPGSPAINCGDLSAVAGAGGVPEFDQRGMPFGRVFNGRIDIGAFEYQAASDLNLVVDTLADESDGNYALGDLSLREAILLANTYPSVDTIQFAPALTAGGPATILLTMGELKITDSTTIEGPGANRLTIDASGNDPTPDSTLADGVSANDGDGSRVFNIDNGNTSNLLAVTLSGVTITGGDMRGDGGAILSQENLSIAGCTISGNLSSGGAVNSGGGIYSSGNLTVSASTISGNSTSGDGGAICTFGSTRTLSVTDCTLTGNSAQISGGAIFNAQSSVTVSGSLLSGNAALSSTSGRGGAIRSISQNLAVNDSTLSGNSAMTDGGAIYFVFRLTLVRSNIDGNSSGRDGGGIFGSGMTASDSTISGNTAGRDGGGIRGVTITLTGSTISGNVASRDGGGIRSINNLSLTNSTLSGNTAGDEGGGIYVSATATSPLAIRHSTITANAATSTGGGIFLASGNLALEHTIVAGNTATLGRDLTGLFGAVVNPKFSLIGNNANSGLVAAPIGSPDANGNLIGSTSTPINPFLGPLADNGGATRTHALYAGSPAIDAGDPAATPGTGGVPDFDQRGAPFMRKFGTRIDMGSFERQSLAPLTFLVDTLVDESDGNYTVGDLSLREAIGLANEHRLAMDVIAFDPALTAGGPAVILLTQGELAVIDAVTITGPGANRLTIRAFDPTPDSKNGDGSRVFKIDNGNGDVIDVEIAGVTLTGADVAASGGAINSLENLTIVDSTISGNAATYGGGIYSGISTATNARPTSLTLIDCTVSDNLAGLGGGIFSFGSNPLASSSVAVINSAILDNVATDQFIGGGGIATFGSNMMVSGSTISGNRATVSDGGGIAFSRYNKLTVSESTISGNMAARRAGGILVYGGIAAVSNSTISGNHAGSGGGGGMAGYSVSTIAVTDSTIVGNTTTGNGGGISGRTVNVLNSTIRDNEAVFGGGISIPGGSLTVTASTITNNSASVRGGGIDAATDFQIRLPSNVSVIKSTISDNTAGVGGGIASAGESRDGFSPLMNSVTVIDSTISGNSTLSPLSSGGGVNGRLSNMAITGSTISGNSAGGFGGGIVNWGSLSISHSTITANTVGSYGGGILGDNIAVTHTIIAGNTHGVMLPDDIVNYVPMAMSFSLLGVDTGAMIADNGGNKIGTAAAPINPLLGPLADNGGPTRTHALLVGSPALNAGDSLFAPPPEFDQRGAPFGRVNNGRIDIGAIESQPIPPAVFGDYNGDGGVDAADYIVWRKTLGGNVAPYSGADGDGNGTIEKGDYDVWRSNFGQTLGSGSGASVAVSRSSLTPGKETGQQPSLSLESQESTASTATTIQPLPTSRAAFRGMPSMLGLVPQIESQRMAASTFAADAPVAAPQDDALLAWLASRHVNQENAEGKWNTRPEVAAAGAAEQDASNESLDAAFASLALGG